MMIDYSALNPKKQFGTTPWAVTRSLDRCLLCCTRMQAKNLTGSTNIFGWGNFVVMMLRWETCSCWHAVYQQNHHLRVPAWIHVALWKVLLWLDLELIVLHKLSKLRHRPNNGNSTLLTLTNVSLEYLTFEDFIRIVNRRFDLIAKEGIMCFVTCVNQH